MEIHTSASDACVGAWFEQLACTIAAPAWSANLLASLLATGIALFGAVFVLRRQLAHDRVLAAEQARLDRLASVESRAAVAADQLGRALIALIEVFDNTATDEIGRLLRAHNSAYPDDRKLAAAYDNMRHYATPDQSVMDLWRELIWTWRVCSAAVLARSDVGGTVDENAAVGLAIDAAINPTYNRCRALARALINWDGHGKLPGREVLGEDWDPPSPQDRTAQASWTARVVARFDEILDKQLAGLEK